MEYSIDLAITHQITSQGHFCVRLCVFSKAAIEVKLGKLTRFPKENFLFVLFATFLGKKLLKNKI